MKTRSFLARDVAEWIEHSNPTEMLRGIDECEKLNSTILSAGQHRESTFLTEDGLYEVLMQSRKPIAKQFKREVKEILRTIRINGAYLTPAKVEETLLNPDTIINLAVQLKAEREHRTLLAQQIERDAPKVLFADSVSATDDCILVRDMAKLLMQSGYVTGEKRLYDRLRRDGYLIRQRGSDYNHPTQKSKNLGLFIMCETTVTYPNGRVCIFFTPRITGKGQLYFMKKYAPTDKATSKVVI